MPGGRPVGPRSRGPNRPHPCGNLIGIGPALDSQAILAERGGRWQRIALSSVVAGHVVYMLTFARGGVGWAAAMK